VFKYPRMFICRYKRDTYVYM